MKKILTSLLAAAFLFLLISPVASEAGIQFGIRAGANSAKFIGSDVNWVEEMAGLANGKYGLVGGIFFAINIGKSITIEPEFLYTMKGMKMDDPLGEYTGKLYGDYLEIPLLLKLRLPTPVIQPVVFAGPSVGFKLREKLQINGEDVPLEEKMLQNNDYGAIFGAGLDFGRHFMIDIRYSLGLKKVIDTAEGETPLDVKNGVWSATIGIAF
jgi:hypothetical protein